MKNVVLERVSNIVKGDVVIVEGIERKVKCVEKVMSSRLISFVKVRNKNYTKFEWYKEDNKIEKVM
ncbi:hypothetical protein CN495_08605 [Bacillus thuringiensis]|uniref:DUF2187 domain-containing protein n=1 Tax=Bacillus thuringiensis TaxID=1428 RepID=A0ABD6SF43_BACTU|nr:hypothetical protein [Bacillus thuringiensis]PER55801.1 hypothetical protein CN495_08605 [Bacillus thuringiensis]